MARETLSHFTMAVLSGPFVVFKTRRTQQYITERRRKYEKGRSDKMAENTQKHKSVC